MGRAILVAGAFVVLAGTAVGQGAQEYITARDKLMCRTQQSLREALKAIEAKDRQLLRTVQGCHYSIEGVRAEVLQDSVSMLKIRLGEVDQATRDEFWVLPDSIKPASGRR